MKPECCMCGKKFKKIDKYTYTIECECYGDKSKKGVRINIG